MAPALPRRLVFETHATSLDNEAGLASGHYDVDLSATGERQALALGHRYAADPPARVLTSDLRRAWRTASLAFGDHLPIVRDARLRECDYGQLARTPVRELDRVRLAAIVGWVLVIGHRATHYALEHLLRGVPLVEAVSAPFSWQPGGTYELS